MSDASEKTNSKRDCYIDFLRFLGLSLIILAHINAPLTITQIRCFDVPLMVFVSGMSFKTISTDYLTYVKKRFIRLYKPVAIFLTVFFGTIYLFKVAGFSIIPISEDIILGSYLLLQEPSIGFVWIIRVFILIAFIAPFCSKILKSINFTQIILLIFGIIIAQTVLCWASIDLINETIFNFLIVDCIYYAVGYSIFFCAGILAKRNIVKFHIWLILGLCFLLISVASSYPNFDISAHKYPPTGTFLFYGMAGCALIYSAKPILLKLISSKLIYGIIRYISINSIWIYLWHIPFVFLINHYINQESIWSIRWLIVYVLACLISRIQNSIKLVNFK